MSLDEFGMQRENKYEASSLKQFCQKFDEFDDKKMLIQPYLPKTVRKGESHFAIVVECEHAVYEVGLPWNFFYPLVPNHFLPSFLRMGQKTSSFDFDKIRREIKRFRNFVSRLSLYLKQKGYPATVQEVQHLGRIPGKVARDDDLRIFVRLEGSGMKDFKDRAVWGSTGDFLYGIVYNRNPDETFDVYVAPLPEGKIALLPFEEPENKVNTKKFTYEIEAREFLKEYLIREKKVPEEKIPKKLLDTYRFQRPEYKKRRLRKK